MSITLSASTIDDALKAYKEQIYMEQIYMDRDEAIQSVLSGLQRLIVIGKNATTARAYSPSCNPDNDDDIINEGKKQVAKLRDIRQQFEDLLLSGDS